VFMDAGVLGPPGVYGCRRFGTTGSVLSYLPEVAGQGVAPVGKGGEAVLDEFGLVQAAVEGAGGLAEAVFGGGDRVDDGGEAGLAVDLAGEVVPADVAAFVGGVVVAVAVGLDHIDEEAGQVKGVGGGADLVVDDADLVVGPADAEHGLDEVFAVFAEDPGDADDEVFVKEGGDGELSVQLGAAVDVEGAVVLAVGLPGVGALAVKDVVGREVEHLGAGLFGGDGDVAGAAGVDGGDFGDVVLVLGGVDGGPGGAVDDGVGAELIDGCGDGGGVSDVELDVGGGGHGGAVGDAAVDRGDVGANGLVAPGDGFVDYIVAELAAHAGDENFHGGLLF